MYDVADNSKEQNNLDRIWSEEYWHEEATRIEIAYYNLIKDKIPAGSFPTQEVPPTEHRIEEFVRNLSMNLGIPNLHVGLTSSDLEDNIRIKRLEDSVTELSKRARQVMSTFENISLNANNDLIMAYTHLMPAGKTTVYYRFAPTLDVINQYLNFTPVFIYRGIQGAIGDRNIQQLLGLTGEQLNSVFGDKIQQRFSHQASDHYTDYQVACWIVGLTSAFVKLANDIRMMFALGQLCYEKDDIGSTALAHKAPNPWRFERIAGMFTSIINLPATIATASANCLLERTLTDQSVLSIEFGRSFVTAMGIINDFEDGLNGLKIIQEVRPFPDSEIELINSVLKGHGRLEAHITLNKTYAGQK